mmetsp:Transcript_21242/g.82416  ORF Transcript_21242/g.82416 Transcript_21242/m.82416 type:complete len:486 (-) Transcript_21242:253-1710(-)
MPRQGCAANPAPRRRTVLARLASFLGLSRKNVLDASTSTPPASSCAAAWGRGCRACMTACMCTNGTRHTALPSSTGMASQGRPWRSPPSSSCRGSVAKRRQPAGGLERAGGTRRSSLPTSAAASASLWQRARRNVSSACQSSSASRASRRASASSSPARGARAWATRRDAQGPSQRSCHWATSAPMRPLRASLRRPYSSLRASTPYLRQFSSTSSCSAANSPATALASSPIARTATSGRLSACSLVTTRLLPSGATVTAQTVWPGGICRTRPRKCSTRASRSAAARWSSTASAWCQRGHEAARVLPSCSMHAAAPAWALKQCRNAASQACSRATRTPPAWRWRKRSTSCASWRISFGGARARASANALATSCSKGAAAAVGGATRATMAARRSCRRARCCRSSADLPVSCSRADCRAFTEAESSAGDCAQWESLATIVARTKRRRSSSHPGQLSTASPESERAESALSSEERPSSVSGSAAAASS